MMLLACLAELSELATRTYVSPYAFAVVHRGLDDMESWKKIMQASFEERSRLLVYLKCASWDDSVRSDPFFQELVRRVGLH